MAACALCVGVGYLSDPAGIGGLAHYVEHMCFMGTRDFPDENGWSKHISKHGGTTNAETDAETTVYYFDIHPSHLKQTLRRFGSFFSCPLFKWSGSRREVQAIHNEFEQAAQNDDVREWQVLSSLTQPGHPYHRFGWGNQRSLVDEPKQAALDMRSELLHFHERHYSAARMTCVVIGREPLDLLQEWAADAFGPVVDCPTASSAMPPMTPTPPMAPMAPSSLPMLLHVDPLEQRRTMTLYWFVPPQRSAAHLASRPTDFVGHLLGHEGSGSALSELKRRGWATELAAGIFSESDSTSVAALMAVSVELTRSGVVAIDEIVCVVCGYLGLLSREAPPERLYDEMRDVAALSFRFAEREPEMEYARRLALSMQNRHAPEATLSGDCLYGVYQPALVEQVIKEMTPAKLLMVLSIKEAEEEEDTRADDGKPAGPAVAAPPTLPPMPMLQPSKRPQRMGRCVCQPGQRCELAAHRGLNGARSDVQKETWFGSTFQKEEVTAVRQALWQAAFNLTALGAAAEAPAATSVGVALSMAMECDEDEGEKAASAAPTPGELVRSLRLPLPNEFIPTDFTLRHPKPSSSTFASTAPSTGTSATQAASKKSQPPTLLHHAPEHGCLFYQPDRRFYTPKACLWLSVERQHRQLPSVADVLLGTLASEVALEALNEASYAATVAGLGYSLSATLHGFALSAAGFSHKLVALALRVCEALAATLAGPVDAPTYERAKQKLSLSLANAGHVASERAHEARLELIEQPHYTAAAQLEALEALGPSDLDAFLAREWRGADVGGRATATAVETAAEEVAAVETAAARAFTTVVACGNLSATEATGFYHAARAALHLPEYDGEGRTGGGRPGQAQTALDGCVVLPRGPPRCVRVAATNAAETNNAIELYWQLGPYTFELAAHLDLLVHLMYEPLFDQLRTKEQLGYSVACGARDTKKMLGFAITVTSAVASPSKAEARAHRFVGRFLKTLGAMRPATFGANVDAAVANKLRDDVNLADESARIIDEIHSQQFIFDRAEREAAAMRGVTHAALVAWARKVLLKEDARRLSVHAHKGRLPHAPEHEPLPPDASAAGTAREFREVLDVYLRELHPLPMVGSP